MPFNKGGWVGILKIENILSYAQVFKSKYLIGNQEHPIYSGGPAMLRYLAKVRWFVQTQFFLTFPC